MVATEGRAFGAMAAPTNGEYGSRRSAGGQGSIFVSGSTVVKEDRFWRTSLGDWECSIAQSIANVLLKKLPRIERNRVFVQRTCMPFS